MEETFSEVASTLKVETYEQEQLLPQLDLDQHDSRAPGSVVVGVPELNVQLQKYTEANAALAKRLEACENENLKLRSQNEELVKQLQRMSAQAGESILISGENGKRSVDLPPPFLAGEGLAEYNPIKKIGSLDLRTATWLLAVLEDAPVYMTYCDSELRFVWGNRTPIGVSKEEVVGKRLDDISSIQCEGKEEFIKLKKRALQSGQVQVGEITTQFPGHGRKTWLVTTRPHSNEEGAIVGVSTAAIDITEQAELKECLSKLRAEMAAHKATEDELRRAVQVTEEAIQAKNVFLAIMSHEIRTPLNGLLGLAEALDSLDLNEEQRELVSAILSSGVIIADILGDILDLASMEFGVLELEERPFDPSEIVHDIMKMAIAATRGKDVIVSSEFVTEIPSKVIGDAVRVRQILKYLVLNAIKFTERGNVRVKLSVQDPVPVPQSGGERVPSLSIARSHSSSVSVVVRAGADIDPSGADTRQWERSTGVPQQRPRTAGNIRGFSDFKLWIDESPERISPAHVMLYCEVVDTGVGIPKEAFPTLFDKFRQVSEGPTRSYGGTGLGLAICKRLVEFMGGQLTVSSEVGKGSTFAFTVLCKTSEKWRQEVRFIDPRPGNSSGIPQEEAAIKHLAPQSASQVQETSVAGAVSSSTPPKPMRPRILLAEDNKVNVMVAISMLKRLGFTAKVVANGLEALEAIRKDKYDLVLLDVCMPLMDGLQVAYAIRKFEQTGEWPEGRELGDIFQSSVAESAGQEAAAAAAAEQSEGGETLERTSSGNRRIPIVAVTANALRADVDKCFAHGMDAFIAKPVMFQKLQEILNKYLPTAAATTNTSNTSTGAESAGACCSSPPPVSPSLPV